MNASRIELFFVTGVVALAFFVSGMFYAANAAENLIANPDLEQTSAAGLPTGWIAGKWGVNDASFAYPVAGVGGGKAAQVNIETHASGDAKWAFAHVPVTPGKEYRFSDQYHATVSSIVTAQYKMADGTFTYKDIAQAGPKSVFTDFVAVFTPPEHAISATVFHLINQPGSLTVDAYRLEEFSTENLIANSSLELAAGNGSPSGWLKGKWGTNAASFVYPVAGYEGAQAARVEIGSYASGDAKWYFEKVPVTSGRTYEFSDYYRGNAKSYVTVQFTSASGALSYLDIGVLEPSPSWSAFQNVFIVPAGTVSLTVFHLIKTTGYLETDAYALVETVSSRSRFPEGLVSLNFDDGYKGAYQNAIPILNQAGFRSDQFIITERLTDQFPGYVKPHEVLAMQAAGHVIGAHTVTHANLAAIPLSEAKLEIENSKSELQNLGAAPVSFFSYPYGAYTSAVQQLVKDAGFLAGRSSDGGYNQKNQDIYALRRQPMLQTTTIAEVKARIDTAMAEKSWVILLFHDVSASGGLYSVTPAFFQEVVDYLKEKQITPVTIGEALDLM